MTDGRDERSLAETRPLTRREVTRSGTLFDNRFMLEREVGRGGMGIVYAAHRTEDQSPVAVKIVPVTSSGELARVRREGAILGQLAGPHFVNVLETGVVPPHAYVVMELLDGEDLTQRLARVNHLPPKVLKSLSGELASGLQFAHDLGYVHRDLKPANIFLEHHPQGDHVKLLDFGLAKHLTDDIRLTVTGILLGSPSFMAPGQIEKPRLVDHRADLWSYAVVLYRMLTGALPFGGAGGRLLAGIQAAAHRPATSWETKFPASIDPFFDRALAKRPDDRFQSADELHAAFVEALPS